ncbi:asparagine synthetase B [bacterium]|nr:asparagine synthetase B [bacterium]
MSGIFGCINQNPVHLLAAMDNAMAHWGPDRHAIWHDSQCGLGQRLLFNTPESIYERLPRAVDAPHLTLTAESRLDNRAELCDIFAIPRVERPEIPDSELILRAYLKWGEACPDHLLGDWSFAIWLPDEQKLFLARDHHGNTSLVYWQQGKEFAFASDPVALYAAGAPRRLNELYLAQVLVSWFAYHGAQTIDLDIQHLPPAHAMTVTPEGIRIWRYWRLEETPPVRLPKREEYVQGFLEIYDEAVRCRLRSHRPVGTTLSGGLDSGSVTALASCALGGQGKRLTAFTAVPIYDTSKTVGANRFGDEAHLAALTSAHWQNIDHHLLNSAQITPIQGIQRTLTIMPEPGHAAGNYFWIVDLLSRACEMGLGTLLTGQGGNATVSWTGAPALRSPAAAFRDGGWKEGVRRTLPHWLLRPILAARQSGQDWLGTAIHADFAHRIHLVQQRNAALGQDINLRESWRSPQDCRHAIILPGASQVGAIWARFGASAGLEVRDPTQDKRVMTYTLSIPDEVFDGPNGGDRRINGGDRWLLRVAMAGLLPDEVRLNPLRGRQSADLAERLLAGRDEMERALAAVDHSPANLYLDVAKMRQSWRDVETTPSPMTTHRAGLILLRGLLAGFFLNEPPLHPLS